MEKKRGWWALIGMALAPLALYAGAYYYEVRPTFGYTPTPPTWTPKIFASYRDERPGYDRLGRIFWPIHQLDRKTRPSLWTAPPARTPVPSDLARDPLMPMNGGEVKLPWGTRQNPPVADQLAKWARALGCQTEPREVSDQQGIKRLRYPSSSGGPELSVIYLEGHGHQWPGGKRSLPEGMIGPITSKLDATDEIWQFFADHGAGR